MGAPIDIEDHARRFLAAAGLNASAVPLPPDFAERLPFALVTRTGGRTYHRAADLHMVSVDVYAATWAAASAEASSAVAAIRDMGAAYTEGVQFYVSDCSMPYVNQDTNHADVPRYTFTATITSAGTEQ